MTNPGLSGAPVVFRDIDREPDWIFKVAGVAVGFHSEAARVLRRLGEMKPEEVKPDDVTKGKAIFQDGHWYNTKSH